MDGVSAITDTSTEIVYENMTIPNIQKNVNKIITVSNEELIGTFLDVVDNHKMILENSGLLTLAALKHLNFTQKKIVSILSGGNMDIVNVASIIQNGLIQRERVFTVSIQFPDKPGELLKVSSVIAQAQGNVIKLDHNQFINVNRNHAVELVITLEAYGQCRQLKLL